MLRRLYNLLFPLAFVLLLPGYLRRMVRRGNYRRHLGQRFGWYAPAVRARLAAGPMRPWIQAVSVGEMLVALKLVAAWRARCPDAPLILSTTTTTGFTLATARAPAGVEVVYTPIDASVCLRRAFEVLRPSRVIIVDGGLWPNLLWLAQDRGLHVALINARLSPRSERRWRTFSRVARPIMQLLDLVCVPEAADVARWQALGVSAERIRVTGSVKFDDLTSPVGANPAAAAAAKLWACLQALGVPADARILLAGSTHPGEERAVAEAYLHLRARFPDLFLIIAPRHAERAPEIRAELAALSLSVAVRSAILPPAAPPEILLLDTTGELRDWYALATVVFIGKSLTAVGGQNPMEAIAVGKPVIFGPRMDNFRALASQLLAVRGAIEVADGAALEQACAALLADPFEAARQAAAAAKVLAAHAGAAVRTVDLLMGQEGFPSCQPG